MWLYVYLNVNFEFILVHLIFVFTNHWRMLCNHITYIFLSESWRSQVPISSGHGVRDTQDRTQVHHKDSWTNETNNHSLSHPHFGLIKVTNQPNIYVFGLWKEIRETPHLHRENMQNVHSQDPVQLHSCWEETAPCCIIIPNRTEKSQ